MTAVLEVEPPLADEAALLSWLAAMREEQPVWRDRWDGWHVFRRADVATVLGDQERFAAGGLRLDPAELRAASRAVLDPGRVAALETHVRRLVRRLLDRAGDRFDLVDAIARPLARGVRAELSEPAAAVAVTVELTTALQLPNVVRTLDEHPELWSAMREDPGLIPGVVEEALRYRGPVAWLRRVPTVEVELSGVRVPAGSAVVAWLLSAHRDPRVHAEPDRFDPWRRRPAPLVFGNGALARLPVRVALEEFLLRWDRLVVEPRPGRPESYGHQLVGVRRLPVHAELGW